MRSIDKNILAGSMLFIRSSHICQYFFIYRDVHKSGWQWRALRLLSKKSRHLFEQTQTPARKIPDYLEDIMRKLAKEITVCYDIY